MADIKGQLIKDSYNYVLQSDITTGIVYRIGGAVPTNPIFQSGLTINQSFTFSDGSEQNGYVLTSDASGNASWRPISAATPSSGVTSITVGTGLSANSSTGAVTIVFTGSTSATGDYLPLSGGTVSGKTYFTSGLTANTLTVTGLTQTSGLTSTGGITFPQITINSSYTATTSDYMIDVSGGTFNIQLPTAVGVQGKLLAIKNNGGGAVTILPYGSQTIDDKSFLILSETNAVQLVSNGNFWVILGQDRSTINNSTGVFVFTGLSKVSSTQFAVAPVKGWITDTTTNPLSPQILFVYFSGGTFTDSYVNTSNETFVYLTSGGTIQQQSTPLTEQQRRQNIFLGKIGHPDRTTINLVFSQPDYVLSPLAQLRDMFVPINLINGGVYPSPNGANLQFNTSAGYLYGLGINFAVDTLAPNTIYVPGNSPTTFQYRTQTGGTIVNVTSIDPTKYDVGGAVTNITGTKATNQRVYLLQNGTIRVQYGQTTYNTFAAAVQGLQTETFVTFPNFTNNAILIGILSVLSTATDLSDTSKAQFFLASKFGETIGAAGGIGTTTLQQAYNNSSEPEITINSTLDGLTIKNGTGNPDNVAQLLQGANAAGTVTSFIRSDGLISGTTLSTPGFNANSGGITATTVSATTYNNLPVTGLTQGSNITITPNGVGGFTIASSAGGGTFTGGTVSGATNFLNGLTANTISATTYYNLPIDIRVTGGTYNGGQILFTNNTGGTFTVTGITSSGLSANYYGSFSNTNNIPVSGANVATVWTYNTTEISNGIVVQNNSQIKVNNKGIYEFGYSPQIEKTQGTDAAVTIWAAVNGVPVTRSSSTLGLVSNSTYQLPFVSLIFDLNANDYVEFYFSSSNQYVQLTALSGLTTPTRPDSPSLIVVAKQIGLSVPTTLTGDYLPLSGGTVTGGTQFTNGITANTIVVGSTPSLYTTTSTTVTTGTNTIYGVSKTSYNSIFIDYSLSGSTGKRAGTIVGTWDGSSVEFNETSTKDIGDTSAVTFSIALNTTADLVATISSSTWLIKTIIKSI